MKFENHQNFLDNIQSYRSAKNYWKSRIEKIAGNSYQNWVENKFGNGLEIMDGNPLFSARFNDKAIRIIQSKRNTKQPKLIAWLDNASLDNKNISELVVALQPYQTSFDNAIYLIKEFSQSDPGIEDSLIKINQKFEKEWEKKQLRKQSWKRTSGI